MGNLMTRLGIVGALSIGFGYLIGNTAFALAMVAFLSDPVCPCKENCHLERTIVRNAQGQIISNIFNCVGGCGTAVCNLVQGNVPGNPPPPPGFQQVSCYCDSTPVVEEWCYMGYAYINGTTGDWQYTCRQQFPVAFCSEGFICTPGYCNETGPGGSTIIHENCCCQQGS